MAIGGTVILIGLAIIIILALVKFKKLKHELFAIFLIALLLFGVFSFTMAFKGKDLAIKDMASLEKLSKIYLSWLMNAMNNVKIVTAQVVKMNWQGNRTA